MWYYDKYYSAKQTVACKWRVLGLVFLTFSFYSVHTWCKYNPKNKNNALTETPHATNDTLWARLTLVSRRCLKDVSGSKKKNGFQFDAYISHHFCAHYSVVRNSIRPANGSARHPNDVCLHTSNYPKQLQHGQIHLSRAWMLLLPPHTTDWP